MQPKKEEELYEMTKHENSNFKLSTNLSVGELSAYKDSAHKRFALQSGFKEIGPSSPQLFSHQKKSAVRLGYSPYLPMRSPELVFSRFMKDRPSDYFDIFEYKRPMVESQPGSMPYFGEAGYPEHRTDRRISFKKEQEDFGSSGFSFTSPYKKPREKLEDYKAVNSLVGDDRRLVISTPEKGTETRFFKHLDSTALNTSERRYQTKNLDGANYRSCRLALEPKLDYADNCEGPDAFKASKGLKTLSQRVKEIVAEKRKTSYKEVASLLIEETRTYMDDLSVYWLVTQGPRRAKHQEESLRCSKCANRV
jgi:hypothetical protein